MSSTNKPQIDPNEWDAQERGLRAALGQPADGLDATATSYRLVAEAVISMPHTQPPADFAADVVQRVARHEAGLERLLSRVLLVVFLIACVFVAVHYGEPWWQALHLALDGEAMAWLLAGAGCMAVSWLCGRLPELAGHTKGTKLAP